VSISPNCRDGTTIRSVSKFTFHTLGEAWRGRSHLFRLRKPVPEKLASISEWSDSKRTAWINMTPNSLNAARGIGQAKVDLTCLQDLPGVVT
jgi:hypothetical protein